VATAAEKSVPSVASIFSRVLVGVDGSPESLEAAWQAAVLAGPKPALDLVTAWELAPPTVTPMTSLPEFEPDEREARRQAEILIAAAKSQFPSARTHVVKGFAGDVLLHSAQSEQATLIAVGSHGQRRLEGILLGSTATRIVHDAPCSVLLARSGRARYPERIVVGVDGSPSSALAYAAAAQLAERFGGEVAVVVAEGEKTVDLPAISLIVGDTFRVTPEEPVPVLVAASADADLLVVGSRGLHGLRALGSVSERVAHRAACSTLIVR
jgi:nucleotide-binding universal stress UspA family protein